METIRQYIETMFRSFPQTTQVSNLKDELIGSMEDKYNELKQAGKSENEAVGIVISEFGNIEELMSEIGVEQEEREAPANELPRIDAQLAQEFMQAKHKSSLLTACGVLLCILSPVVLIALTELPHLPMTLGLIVLCLLVACAVPLFITSGHKMEPYKILEGRFYLSRAANVFAKGEREAFLQKRTLMNVVGIVIILLAPIFLFLGMETGLMMPAISGALLPVAVGTAFLVYAGGINEGYNMLLELEDYSRKKKEADKVVGAVATVWWPICVVVYLLISFTTGAWGATWLIWPISGILFGAFSGLYSIITDKDK